MKLFTTSQGNNEGIDEFLCRKPRHQEALEKEDDKPTSSTKMPHSFNKAKRCLFCSRKGHVLENCRKRLAQLATLEQPEQPNIEKPSITCYGCGAPGVFRSNCSTCKNKETPPKLVTFYSVLTTLEEHVKIPTIEININGYLSYAYIDTAARTSIAGERLYKMLQDMGTTFSERHADVSLADGTVTHQKLLTTKVDVTLGNRSCLLNLTVMPDATDNRTLLGIDFLESAGIILNLAQRVWYFIDTPNETFPFLQLKNEKIRTLQAKRSITFDEQESLPDFLRWANEIKMISPLPQTPSPRPEIDSPLPKRPRWQLLKLDTPPRPRRPREPADVNSIK